MLRVSPSPIVLALFVGCLGSPDDEPSPVASSFTSAASPLATIRAIGPDTLSDSASVQHLQVEPDGGSIAFLFADPAKGVTQGLGLVGTSGAQSAQLVWPDSVASFWWSGPHQLSFTAGTGQGVRLIVDVHAAQLEALDAPASAQPSTRSQAGTSSAAALRRAQAFVDSIRIQPQGTPQGSALRYQADSIILAPGDTFAAVHVIASDAEGTKVNPAWYLAHLPSGQVQPVDSLTGRSSGLLSRAGVWAPNGVFFYAKERSIWQVRVSAH